MPSASPVHGKEAGQGVSDMRNKRWECCHDSNYRLIMAATAEHLWVRQQLGLLTRHNAFSFNSDNDHITK